MRITGHAVSVFALAACLYGCRDVALVETPPDGKTLCVADFELCVNPIFDAVINGRNGAATCAASGCHDQTSGSGGAFKIFRNAAPGSTEMLANFFSAKAFANLEQPPQSKLLLEPLQGDTSITGTHTGGDIFPATADSCYQSMIAWIGKRVDADDSSACGVCAAPDLAACGY